MATILNMRSRNSWLNAQHAHLHHDLLVTDEEVISTRVQRFLLLEACMAPDVRDVINYLQNIQYLSISVH